MIALVPAFLALPGVHVAAAPWHEWFWQGVFQGVLIGVVSIYVYSNALARLGPDRAAVMTAAVPCVTTIGAVFLLKEAPSWLVLGGIALVTAGMLLSLLGGRGRSRSSA
jgi:drug/metabolite transporter (DMT)-like permease